LGSRELRDFAAPPGLASSKPHVAAPCVAGSIDPFAVTSVQLQATAWISAGISRGG